MKRPWVLPALAAGVAVILVAAALTVFLHLGLQPRPQNGHARHQSVPTPGHVTPTPGHVTPTPGQAAQRLVPGTLVIPKINVRASIEQVTVDSGNNMAAPQKPSDVGWYSPGVAPGQDGDAVIDGHLDWYGVPQAVFYDLNQLTPGDNVDVVSQSSVVLHFKVTGSTLVASTAHPAGLFETTGSPRLTLITCAGDWNPSTSQYGQRLLVDAVFTGTG